MDVRLEDFAALLSTQDAPERESLIARAKLLAMNQAAPEAFDPPIRTAAEYLATPIEVPPILVEPSLVVRGGITCTIGRAGKGKTQINLNRILKWACGRPLFDGLMAPDGETPVLAPTQPLKILVIENEGAAGMFHKQLGIMVHAKGWLSEKDRKQTLENVLIWGDGGYSGLKLDDENQLNEVRAGCEEWEPDIVFIEPFRGLWQGDENSSTDMAKVADALSGVASDYNCAVILTHHERKTGAGDDGEKMSAGRGSTVLEGVVATMENFEIAKGGDFRELSWSKVRYGAGAKLLPVRMEWQPKDWWYAHVPMDKIEQAILDVLAAEDEPQTIGDLMLATDESDRNVRKIIKSLSEQGKVKSYAASYTGNGSTGKRYRLTSPATDESGGIDF